MSRVGKMPIPLPQGVEVAVESGIVAVKGPKGTLSRPLPAGITLRQEDGRLLLERRNDEREQRSLHGLMRALVANMVAGVADGFSKVLEVYGVGYRAQKQGERLTLQIGYSHPVEVIPPAGISLDLQTFTPTADNNYLASRITVSGIDREQVGELAAKIRAAKKPEPYKGKGIRYANEVVRRKAGKAAKSGKK